MNVVQFPAQQLPLSRKSKSWRKQCVDFADSKLHFNYNLIRNSVIHQKINYDLVAGKLHMTDLELICNPDNLKADFIPTKIQHYPIINAKLNILKGEEIKRAFNYKVVVTNPTAVSEVEQNKKQELFKKLQELVQDASISEEEFQQNIQEVNQYYNYEWQDIREIRGNCTLNHYSKECNFPEIFNSGFMDGMIIGEEMYQCDIVGGEPVLERLNPLKVRIFKSGYSNRIEDADMIILEDYWSPGKVIDRYSEVLSSKDIQYLENYPQHFSQGAVDNMDNIDERFGFVNYNMMSDVIGDSTQFFDPFGEYTDSTSNDLLPFDLAGNVRVIRVYWKSRRKIKKVKYYDPETGDEEFTFMPENYILDDAKGEEEEAFWINQAWEGTKIGQDIYVNMRPRVIQYNRLDNPSRCHFGIVGGIYNINDDRPYSLVDMMKPFNYLYDIIHDRLNKLMARNWGKMTRLDLSKKPKGWKMEKWLYYAKTMGLFVENSFNEGEVGRATGVLAGAMNSNTQGVIDADFGNNIQQYINLLEYIKAEMSEVAGISKQREGQISNRETVGGVERATLQSSHITEWLFTIHDNIKKRALEVFLETAKIAFKGRKKKFQYILPDFATKMIDIDGDEFAECDYGIVVDNSNDVQNLNQKLEGLAQAALQNQALDFSTIMKLYTSASLAEKQRMVEASEQKKQQEMQQQQQQQMQMQQEALQMQQEAAQKQLEYNDLINQRDNETKVLVAEINSQAEFAVLQLKNHLTEMDMEEKENTDIQATKQRLMEEMRQFDSKIALEREKVALKKREIDEKIKQNRLPKK